MDEEHPAKRKKSRWWPISRGAMRFFAVLIAVGALLFVFRGFYLEHLHNRPRAILGAATAVVAIVVLIRVGQHYQWTGFGESVRPKSGDQEIQARKTLWDWLQLFIVPLALAAIGLWFAAQQEARQQQIEAKRAQNEQHIEEQRAQDAALQAYLDQMSQLMLEGNLRDSEGSSERTLARARTRTVLGRLNSRRKGSVVQFLYEASLIDKEHPIVSLSDVRLRGADLSGATLIGAGLFNADLIDADLSGGANLSDADLRETDLNEADLSNAILSGANLSGANLIDDADLSSAHLIDADLIGADLSGANLSGANLSSADLSGGANLSGAGLSGADLSYADLSDVYLSGADLGGTNLSGADLSGADLSGVKDVGEKQLEEAKSLEGATMPNGSIHD
jgi:uncharacterized protein YjbI with pentapeptide repeats